MKLIRVEIKDNKKIYFEVKRKYSNTIVLLNEL